MYHGLVTIRVENLKNEKKIRNIVSKLLTGKEEIKGNSLF